MKNIMIASFVLLVLVSSAFAEGINCALPQRDVGATRGAVDFFRANACAP